MRTTVVIIGAGQAGLAMSRCLTRRSVDHVLIERGDCAESWRAHRWDSLRLLTPNWLSRLPGWHYRGDDPNGFMTAAEVADHLTAYRSHIGAPVVPHTTVTCVRVGARRGFEVITDDACWATEAVVIATGAARDPHIPPLSKELPSRIMQLSPLEYRNPSQLPDGPTLVVGASASGLQIADELARSGRAVTIAVGDHVRTPRTYRGRDIHWWMDAIGLLDERYDEVEDIDRARRLPSLQLIGTPDRRALDINELQRIHEEVATVGRLVGIRGSRLQFAGSLANVTASADLKLRRLLDRVDLYASTHGLDGELEAPMRPDPTRARAAPDVTDLRHHSNVVWATGFRPRYPWLDQRHVDSRGAIRHDGGVMDEPGMYVLGLPFLRRRKSSFLDGVGADAADLTDHLVSFLGTRRLSTLSR